MKRHIKYPSIDQFRSLVKKINDQATYDGVDENGEAKFDYFKPKPILTLSFSEKIHGTNAACCYSEPDGLWLQSRERIITSADDNMGFAFFAENNEHILIIIKELANEYNIDLNNSIISLYGEWAGGNIMKNSALSSCEKVFVLFEYFKVSPVSSVSPKDSDEEEIVKWYPTKKTIRTYAGKNSFYGNENEPDVYDINHSEYISSDENKIFNIMNFKTWTYEIDFSCPEKIQNYLLQTVDEIEESSPLGRAFGQESNIGEGVVGSYYNDGYLIQCKLKGEKHANSPVKTLKPVDTAKLDKIDKCVNEICHDWRFEQMLIELFGSDYEKTIDRSKIGMFLKLVNKDTIKEESSIIRDYGFEPKDILPRVGQAAKKYFLAVESNLI